MQYVSNSDKYEQDNQDITARRHEGSLITPSLKSRVALIWEGVRVWKHLMNKHITSFD